MQADAALQELVNDGKCTILPRAIPGGNGARVAWLDASYLSDITFAGLRHVVAGWWTRYRLKLLEKKKVNKVDEYQEQGHIAAKCKGQVRPPPVLPVQRLASNRLAPSPDS